MNKGMKYFTEGLLAAFVLAPRVPVHAVEPAKMEDPRPIGNAEKHWEAVGKNMTKATNRIACDLRSKQPELNSL